VFRCCTPGRIAVFIFGGFQLVLGAVTDSVYTHPVPSPDFLAPMVSAPVVTGPPQGLRLIGWPAGITDKIPADSKNLAQDQQKGAAKTDNVAPTVVITPGESQEIRNRGGNFLKIKMKALDRWSEIDSSGSMITFYAEHDGTTLKLPTTVSFDWYVPNMVANKMRELVRSNLSVTRKGRGQTQTSRQRTIELLGADIAGQRVSLRVSGNVVITGNLNFKDKEKVYTNYGASKDWDVEIDQTQRFNIEGNIGDRISVLVNQDSENEFDWENDMKIAYTGAEDEILKRIDAGNISLNLPGTQFATGGSGKSSGLFGIKAESQLGPVNLTTVASIERSKKSTKSNALTQDFVISDLQYMRNRYFFLDMPFRANYYPLDAEGRHTFDPNRVIGRLEVYRSASEGAATFPGTAYIDPNNTDSLATAKTEAHFQRLFNTQDYSFERALGTIRLRTPASQNDIIAVAYTLGRLGKTAAGFDTVFVDKTVGDIEVNLNDSTHIRLKLVKDRGQTPSDPTWPLEFKNVYSLGATNINPDAFEVRVIDRDGATDGDERFTNGLSYLTIFGIDRETETGGPPDELVDVHNRNIINTQMGELHFPALLPFAYSRIPGVATPDSALIDLYGYELEDMDQDFIFDQIIDGEEVDQSITGGSKSPDGDRRHEDLNDDGKFDIPPLYYRSNLTERKKGSRFEIVVQQSGLGASVYNLGFNMVQGSETVKVGEQPLARGVDYTIDSFTNTLTILDMSKYASSDVTIDYEENELISFDKKVMMGARAELDLGENSFLGLTGLYYNQSIADERVDVGSEPIQNMLWDVNGRIDRETPWLTRLVDRLPLVETDAPSRFRIEGEFAQVLPNPNPLGNAYVDDFEGAKRVTSPTMNYLAWDESSAPIDKNLTHRRRMSWWNPFRDYPVKSIWPQRETSLRARNNTTVILTLDTFFDRYPEETRTDSLWAGITYAFYASEYDQTLSKFFEIWLKGEQGALHIDVGTISEDRNGNGKVDTEDLPEGGLTEGNGLLDPGEDVGLDGCGDEFEDGLGGCLGVDDDGDGRIDEETFNYIDDDGDGLIDEDLNERVIHANANLDDPNMDNWAFTESDTRKDYVNGTEGNGKSGEMSYPDNEDINGEGVSFLDNRNDYFTFTIQLDPNHADFDTTLIGGVTRHDNGKLTGWKLFRIPISEFGRAGEANVSWDNVEYLRLWIDGLSNASSPLEGITSRLQVAKIEFVGSEWEELGLALQNTEEYVKGDTAESMVVTVANTEDNADYDPPPDVLGEYDRVNDIRLREQSLVLDFSLKGIPVGHKGAISKSVPDQAGTFLIYNTMEMYVHGEGYDGVMGEDSSAVKFWFRIGQGQDNNEIYYEVRKTVYPGWDDRNHIKLNMAKLAQLKLRDDPDTWITVGNDSIPGYFVPEDNMEVYIKGDPSLERIRRYTMGVMNAHPRKTIRGRVMVDELRLSKVRREGSTALRLAGSLNFADLLSTNFNYSRKEADFHTVHQRVAANARTSEIVRADLRFSPERFLPRSWGLRLPLSASISSSINSPKYYPGKDILAGGLRDAPAEIQKRSQQTTLKGSFAKTSRSKYWIVRQSLDRLKGSVNYSNKRESSELIYRNVSENVSGQLSYPIRFSDENYFRPFALLEPVPWLGEKIKETRLYYSPTSLDFSGSAAEALSRQTTRADQDTSKETYNFSLKRNIKSQYRITDRLVANYSWSADNTLNQFRDDKLRVVRELDPGLPIRYSEQFSTNYDPQFISWLKPKLGYQAQYGWAKNQPLDDPGRGARLNTQGRFSGSVNLTPREIIEVFYTPEGTKSQGASRRSRRTSRSGANQDDEKEKDSFEITNPKTKAVFKFLHSGASKISPIAFNYGYSRRGASPAVVGNPGYEYRLGLKTSPDLPVDTLATTAETVGEERTVTWRSGLSLAQSVNLNLSHNRRWSYNESRGSNTTNSSRSVDYLVLGSGENPGLPFLNWSLRWSGLEKLPLINKIPWRVSMDHTYSGTHVRDIQNGLVSSDKYTRQFQPLIGFTINFTNGVTSNLRASHTQILTRTNVGGETRSTTNRATANMTYRRRGGMNIPLPFFRDFNLQNTVNFSLECEYSKNKTEARKGEAAEFVTKAENSSWGIKPYITYTFTDKVTGSVRLGYEESDHKLLGRQIKRTFGFDVNIAIRGN